MSGAEKNNLPKPLEQLPPELLQKLEERGLRPVIKSLEIQHFSSRPIPSPEELEHYEKIHEGFSNRIVAMAESEQEHRHAIEDNSLKAAVAAEKRGQVFIFIISLCVILGGVSLAYLDHPAWGIGLLLPALGGLAYTLMTGRRRRQQKE